MVKSYLGPGFAAAAAAVPIPHRQFGFSSLLLGSSLFLIGSFRVLASGFGV